MKKLEIFKENGEFVIRRTNEFNHATKRYFITEEGLKEGIEAYGAALAQYEVTVSKELWGLYKSFQSREACPAVEEEVEELPTVRKDLIAYLLGKYLELDLLPFDEIRYAEMWDIDRYLAHLGVEAFEVDRKVIQAELLDGSKITLNMAGRG